MRSHRLGRLVALGALALVIGGRAWAQSPTYGVGRTPTAEEIRAWDISIGPTGAELPPGRGTAVEGARLYVQKGCAGCHGPTGASGKAPILIRRKDPSPAALPCLSPCIRDSTVIGIHAPYATVVWDYVNRGMPLGREGTLKPDEVYALTAFLLFKNDVVKEDDVLDAQSLPKIQMPNKDGAATTPEWKHGTPRLQGYP
jgi:cytochrome c